MVQPLWKKVLEVPQKIKNGTTIPYDPVIPFLGIYLKELKAGTWTDVRAPKIPAALFTVAKM